MKLTIDERVRNAAASQEVENVKAEHSYLHGRADATGEWGNIWSHSDDVSWAHAFGRMRGFDQVWYGSVTRYDAQAMENWLKMYQDYPEVGGKDPRPLLEASVHTLLTDVIGAYMGPGVTLLDSGAEVAEELAGYLREHDLRADLTQRGACRWYVSDSVESFHDLASIFLDREVTEPVEQIAIENY